MKHKIVYFFSLLFLSSCFFTKNGSFREINRIYSSDSLKYILTYKIGHGAWDGSNPSFVSIMTKNDTIPNDKNTYISTFEFDSIFWKNNQTIYVYARYSEFMRLGKINLKDTTINGTKIKVFLQDPITDKNIRKIVLDKLSPSKTYRLIGYRYIQSENNYNFLNISIIRSKDSIPKYGNFFISNYDFDCIENIDWKDDATINISLSGGCYYGFSDYLVKDGVKVKYNLILNDTISNGNIKYD